MSENCDRPEEGGMVGERGNEETISRKKVLRLEKAVRWFGIVPWLRVRECAFVSVFDCFVFVFCLSFFILFFGGRGAMR